jgi:Flavin-binding monooxygenase-like
MARRCMTLKARSRALIRAGTQVSRLVRCGPRRAGRLTVIKRGRVGGIESFRGEAFHSARWKHDAELHGKHVAVIGTGASAAQIVPRIADHVAHLTLFQRTPPWVLPKSDTSFSPLRQWVLRHVPIIRLTLRAWSYWTHEIVALGFTVFPHLLTWFERRARSHGKRQISNEALRHLLTPAYRIGCKRVLLSDDFLDSLTRPNAHVVASPIVDVVPDGLVRADGAKHRAEVVIFATGFQANGAYDCIRIVGRDGVTLSEAWRDGMQARLGVAVSGFPNLFLLGGPNTWLGHNSVVFMLEAQINHVLRCLRLLKKRGSTSVEVRLEAQAMFIRRLDKWMQRTVWSTGCRSWYLDRNGRNTILWPGLSAGYWLRTLLVSGRSYRFGSTSDGLCTDLGYRQNQETQRTITACVAGGEYPLRHLWTPERTGSLRPAPAKTSQAGQRPFWSWPSAARARPAAAAVRVSGDRRLSIVQSRTPQRHQATGARSDATYDARDDQIEENGLHHGGVTSEIVPLPLS